MKTFPRISTVAGALISLPVFLACAGCATSPAQPVASAGGTGTNRAPFNYVRAKAFHILPSTTSEESGYFSLCEGRNGRIYVGTAKDCVNSYLVEFDPATERQQIVIDTHALCGLTNTGYAAQARITTRNFPGPSGKIYVGSKQGYRRGNDTAQYPGGYAMTYNPASGKAENLGLPFPGEGISDIAADEGRGIAYVVTSENQHWMLLNLTNKTCRELGPLLASYTTTLIDSNGRAHALTRDFQVATYDPDQGHLSIREVKISDRVLTAADLSVPCWQIAPDGHMAWLIRMANTTLCSIDLAGDGPIAAISHGPMLDGRRPDSRGALTIAPDGTIYALVRIDNTTGFGKGMLHHLVSYNPRRKYMCDHGVLAVSNPDFYSFAADKDGKVAEHSHGYHTLPDGTLTPLHHHMALAATHDNHLFATILYPFTLLKIDLPTRP